MKIAMICPVGSPRVVGGAERLWQGLVDAINASTEHAAELVEIEAPERSFAELVESYRRFNTVSLDHFDVVISGKYPAWMVTHRCHVVYMCHVLRGLYDTYPASFDLVPKPLSSMGAELGHLLTNHEPNEPGARDTILSAAGELVRTLAPSHPDVAFPGPLSRRLIHWLDRDAMHPTKIAAYLAISHRVAARPDYFPAEADVRVVTPPSALITRDSTRYSDFFTVSRLDGPKRIDLLVDAMKWVDEPVSLRIAGTGPFEGELRLRAVDDRRIVFLGHVSDEQLVDEYAAALAVPFVPLDEDLGLITLEAQSSGKAVITCSDSGGSLELVEHGVDGYVVEPDPRALGRAMATLALDRRLAETMGRHGQARARLVQWPIVVGSILDAVQDRAVDAPPARRRVVVLSTYSAEPARHGGQVRLNRLLQGLSAVADVHLIALSGAGGTSGAIGPGLRQVVLQPPEAYHHLEGRLSQHMSVPTGDIVAALVTPEMTELRGELELALRRADAIVLAHPYLYPAVRELNPSLPIIYDAHNAEWSLKRSMYPNTPIGNALADAVASIEADCLRNAKLVVAVSDDDLALFDELGGTMAGRVVIANGADVRVTPFITGATRRELRSRFLEGLGRAGWDHQTRHVALFLGSSHPPNLDAARDIVRLADDLPDVLFVLVGGHVDGLGGTPTAANVLPRGLVEPDEMQFLLSLADVALNPMSSGSGTNIKMVDYFAAGAPVVATTIGARGFEVADGVHLRIADGDLGAAIRAMLDTPELADAMATAARALALDFEWASLSRQFAVAVNRVMDDAQR